MAATWVPLILLVSRLSSGGGPAASVVPAPTQQVRPAPREAEIVANLFSASVRAFSSAGKDHVVVDAPRYEVMVRPGGVPLYLTIPVALSWGVKGGFTSEASIGFGLGWSPSRYVSLYAQQRLGTFFFNHGTRQRSVGLDVNVPIAHAIFAEGVRRESQYLVIGVEYFDRDVYKWAGFMEGSQWYASGHGVAVRVGIRMSRVEFLRDWEQRASGAARAGLDVLRESRAAIDRMWKGLDPGLRGNR